jgi:hypothetical protein
VVGGGITQAVTGGPFTRGTVVFLTALITPEEAREGRRIARHPVLAKPISSSELIRVVEQNLPASRCDHRSITFPLFPQLEPENAADFGLPQEGLKLVDL